MEAREFHLGDVLSVVLNLCVSQTGFNGLYEILDFLTGGGCPSGTSPLYAIELVKRCGPCVLKQFPQLAEVDVSGLNNENGAHWLAEQVAKYGEYLEVEPIGAFQATLEDDEAKRYEGYARELLNPDSTFWKRGPGHPDYRGK